MKQKELKNLAKRIASLEMALRSAETREEKEKLENEIMKLSSQVRTIADMVTLDDMIRDLLD